MSQIETYARQAWQLSQQGHSLGAIATVQGKSPKTVQRWIAVWKQVCRREPAWYEGLEMSIVSCLRHAGINSREALVEAWENGESRRGHPPGIGVRRLLAIQAWLESGGASVSPVTSKAVIVDLSAAAESALNHLVRATGESPSSIISKLLVAHDADIRGR